jgi:hypothetical protein
VDLSSQEEARQKERQDIDWDLIKKEDGQISEIIEVEVDTGKHTEKGNTNIQAVKKEDLTSMEADQLKTNVEQVQSDCLIEPVEEPNAWDNHSSEVLSVTEAAQEADKDGWPKWQDVRQSKRLRDSGISQIKMGGQAQDKKPMDSDVEGIDSMHQNSFAVLSNPQIISLANKMGIHSDSITFEKIDLLKDLENTRMKLNEHACAPVEHNDTVEAADPPLEEHNVIEWGSEDSDENPYIEIVSVKKSRSSKKKKRKPRARKNLPLEDSFHSEGDKSKVCPRFNLRDRNTIKKVIK